MSSAAAGSGAITIAYFDDDSAKSITRGGVTTTISEDPAGRRLNLTTGTETEVKHYTDDSDNPGWSTRTVGGVATTTRYESTIGGDLALTITGGVTELAVNNPHGDTVTTIPLTGDQAGTGIEGWAQYDEYGNQLTDPVSTGATTYGWHGADQRALDASGLILMGARLYSSVTGLFTTRDPVAGGNTTTYCYPQDPIGMSDIPGLFSWGDAFTAAGMLTAYIPVYGAGIGFSFGMAAASAYTIQGDRRSAAGAAVGSLFPSPPIVGSWLAGEGGKWLYDHQRRRAPHRSGPSGSSSRFGSYHRVSPKRYRAVRHVRRSNHIRSHHAITRRHHITHRYVRRAPAKRYVRRYSYHRGYFAI